MTLSAIAYRSKHIPRSLYFETVDAAVAALDRSEEIVVYCADIHCSASVYAYRFLEREGFTRVRRYAGGVADWEEAGYPLVVSELDRAPSPRTRATLRRAWRVCT
jgi:rhodanese-related sulfurtransferase